MERGETLYTLAAYANSLGFLGKVDRFGTAITLNIFHGSRQYRIIYSLNGTLHTQKLRYGLAYRQTSDRNLESVKRSLRYYRKFAY